MSIKLKTTSNGSVTLSPEDTASDVVLTVPASAGELLNDQSDIETQVKSATNASGDAPIYACRAWVNFNGSGTVAIRESGNVSSITDNGTGDYTVNFTTAMEDVNYSVQGAVADAANFRRLFNIDGGTAFSTSAVRVLCKDAANNSTTTANADNTFMQVAVFR